jgi:hypothetical protein
LSHTDGRNVARLAPASSSTPSTPGRSQPGNLVDGPGRHLLERAQHRDLERHDLVVVIGHRWQAGIRERRLPRVDGHVLCERPHRLDGADAPEQRAATLEGDEAGPGCEKRRRQIDQVDGVGAEQLAGDGAAGDAEEHPTIVGVEGGHANANAP